MVVDGELFLLIGWCFLVQYIVGGAVVEWLPLGKSAGIFWAGKLPFRTTREFKNLIPEGTDQFPTTSLSLCLISRGY